MGEHADRRAIIFEEMLFNDKMHTPSLLISGICFVRKVNRILKSHNV